MATTITRSSLTDDVSVWNAALVNSAVYDKIDAVLAAAVTIGGVLGSEAFGTHSFSASGTGSNVLRIRNTTAGTGNSAALAIGNDTSAGNAGYLTMHSSTYTASGSARPDGLLIGCGQSGGLTLEASHASGRVRLVGAGETVAPADSGSKRATLLISDTGGSSGNGGSIELGAGFGSSTQAHFAAIKSWLDNGSNNTTGSLRFYTRAAATDSSLTERIRVTNQVLVTSGSVSAPGLSFLDDLDSGIYWSSPSSVPEIDFAVGGFQIMVVHAQNALNKPAVLIKGGHDTDHCAKLIIERKAAATTAPGVLALEDKNGTRYYLWVDTTGDLRVGTTEPIPTVGDTGGTVVGTQT